MNAIVYVQLKKKLCVPNKKWIVLGDICQLTSKHEVDHLLKIPVLEANLSGGNYAIVEFMQIVRLIHHVAPEWEVRSAGNMTAIIEIQTHERIPKLLLVILVWIFLFIGSGLAIMNFHSDVNMKKVHEHIYYLLTGQHTHHPLILQIPYSIGIGAGMILFFNHIFKRRFNEEPSPMELEMFSYQETMDQYVIELEKQKREQRSKDDT